MSIERIEVPFSQVPTFEAKGWIIHSIHAADDTTSNRAMVREMKVVRAKRVKEAEVPENWAEAERMITNAMRYHDGRGGNLAIQSVCARIAYGMYGDKWMAADPTQALAYWIQRLCQLKGAGLER
jgi:hypothetical protein